MNTKRIKSVHPFTLVALGGVLCAVLLGGILSITNRTDVGPLYLFYTLFFMTYLAVFSYLAKNKEPLSNKQVIFLFVVTALPAFFFSPALSNDYFRFLWDGELFWRGINPFDFKPEELTHSWWFKSSPEIQELYSQIDPQSQQHFTCYPPANQFYFKLATWVSDKLFWNQLQLKAFVFFTQVIGFIYLRKILRSFNYSPDLAFGLFLNPLFLVETLGNLHFEGVTLSFLILSLYHLHRSNWFFAALFWSLAVQIKLTPLLLLPFLLRYLGWKRSFQFYSIVGVTIAFGLWIELDSTNFNHFLESLQLYFRVFEFNAWIYHYFMELGYLRYGFYPINTYGFLLAKISLISILIVALWDYNLRANWNFSRTLLRMYYGYFIYLLLNSTVHPWYILPLVLLGLLSGRFTGIFWSFLVFFSYQHYTADGLSDAWIHAEYILLLLFFLVEELWLKRKSRITTH